MGIVLWIASGALAFGVARFLRSGGAQRWPLEILIAIAAALLFGVAATAFDFGGWKELEWRAALFAFLGASVILALTRMATLGLGKAR